MRLRLILFILSLIAFVSTSLGGWLYYDSLQSAADREVEAQADIRMKNFQKQLVGLLTQNARPVRILAGLKETRLALLDAAPVSGIWDIDTILDQFKTSLHADICYLVDQSGVTRASSNRSSPDTLVGKNFAFRPYFREAMAGKPSAYLALGTASGRRGAYVSYPIHAARHDSPVGVAVIKTVVSRMEHDFHVGADEIIMVVDPHGIIFISTRTKWTLHALGELSPEETADIAASLQFGKGPWPSIRLDMTDDVHASDGDGRSYLVRKAALEDYPGWQILYLQRIGGLTETLSGPLVRVVGKIILGLCLLISASLVILYWSASVEISRRRTAEASLRISEERYRTIYHKTPAMLHSINRNGELMSVSDYWLRVMGYEREEVIGRKLREFLTKASAEYLENKAIPSYLEKGYLNDVPYRFVKKDREMIDVLLSSFAERDDDGKIVRSLAVSIDITERIRAENDLKQAKEALRSYTKALEYEVKIRTEEISGILKYTPSVIYFKDLRGRYLLVNSRYEALFGVANEAVRGMTDDELHPPDIAEKMTRNDESVIYEGHPFQTEDRILHSDGVHYYLTIKFPIYSDLGKARGVGAISTDITELQHAQEQLRRLSGKIIAGQERERAAIARELHDELGQILTALRMDAVWLRKHLTEADAGIVERTTAMCQLIDHSIEEVRGLAIQLRPGVLDDLGLVEALEWFTGEFEKRTEIACVFDHTRIPELSEPISTTAYRIAQECLTNVSRHAAAGSVRVNLAYDDGWVQLSVTDDGRGFDPASLSDSESLGIAGMRERVSLVGGEMTLCSRPGDGTNVSFLIPADPWRHQPETARNASPDATGFDPETAAVGTILGEDG